MQIVVFACFSTSRYLWTVRPDDAHCIPDGGVRRVKAAAVSYVRVSSVEAAVAALAAPGAKLRAR
jgi:hypothetical protein